MNRIKILFTGFLSLIIALATALLIVAVIVANIYWSQIAIALILFIFITDAIFAFFIFYSKRQTNIKVCWILVICVFHTIGVIAFLIFGTQPFNQKEWAQYRSNLIDFYLKDNFEFSKKQNIFNDKNIEKIFKYNLVASNSAIYENNEIHKVEFGTDLFATTVELIRSAKSTIFFQTYIFKDCLWSRILATELVKKAREGVSIKFMYDWVGCYNKISKKILKQFKKNNIEVAIFNPKGINMFKNVTNYRSHRRVIIIDNKVALYGGNNIGDEYLTISPSTNYWKDLSFIVKGEIVNSMSILFRFDWLKFSNRSYKKWTQKNNEFIQQTDKLLKPSKVKNKCIMQLLKTFPDYEEKTIEQTIIELIRNAKKNIKLVTPYFVPTEPIISSLKYASWSGIKVEIIVPGLWDNKAFIISLNRQSYSSLIKSKCNIYEFNGFIHSKYMVIDDSLVLTGSSNIDYRSLWINFENCLLVYSKEFVKELDKEFASNKNNSTKMNLDVLKDLNKFKNKLVNNFFGMFHPLV